MKSNNVLKKIAFVCLITVGTIAFLFGGLVGYFKLPVSAYYNASEKAFKIPGLKENFVPQGLFYDENEKIFLVSGYNSKAEVASAVYLVNELGESKKINLAYSDGSDFCRHSGGIAVYENWMYVAGSSAHAIYVYDYKEAIECENGASIRAIGSIPLYNKEDKKNDYINTSALTVVGDTLIVNEYHYGEEYPLLDSHNFTTSSGDVHGGYAIFFQLDRRMEFGTDGSIGKVFSICDKVQGMTINKGKIYCSISYGLGFSYLNEYVESNVKKDGEVTLLGKTYPVYSLDSSCLLRSYKMPPMGECVAFVGSDFYVISEFASNKYILGKFTGASWCYKTDLAKM